MFKKISISEIKEDVINYHAVQHYVETLRATLDNMWWIKKRFHFFTDYYEKEIRRAERRRYETLRILETKYVRVECSDDVVFSTTNMDDSIEIFKKLYDWDAIDENKYKEWRKRNKKYLYPPFIKEDYDQVPGAPI